MPETNKAINRKLGPLKTWQWAAIAGGSILLYYLYTRYRSNSAANTAATLNQPTQTTTSAGPIDPTTGIPYSQETLGSNSTGGTGATTGTGTSLQQELSDLQQIQALQSGGGTAANGAGTSSLGQELNDFQSIESLLSGLQSMSNPGATVGPATNTTSSGSPPQPASVSGAITTHKGGPFYNWYLKTTGHPPPSTVQATNALYQMWKAGVSPKQAGGGASNPGHTVTSHPNGTTVSSSAPANGQQHQNVAPPSHQRAPTPHPSTPTPMRPNPAPKPHPAPKPKTPVNHR